MHPGKATLIGFSAIAMWSSLGLLGAASGAVPPFLLNALCFGLSGLLAVAWVASRRGGTQALRQPLGVVVFGALGLFGFHALYFTAIRNAPPVEANLINYTWPILIVLMAGLVTGEPLRVRHLIGAGVGLAGVAMVLSGAGGITFAEEAGVGYLAALGSAVWWAAYSVMARRMRQVPTSAVALFCCVTAVLSAGVHLAIEETVWPAGVGPWGAVVLLGLFPVGLAFFAWDHGMKHGHIQLLAAGAYAAPLLSTLAMILAGYGAMTPHVAAACLAIPLGAAIAAWRPSQPRVAIEGART
jgi:drug/metabolite transporter (DMT)-like permease